MIPDLFTENNGKWFCPVRAVGLLAIGVFLFLEVWTVCVKHHDFDAIAFGTAFAAILGAYTASITAKGKLLEGNPGEQ